MTSQLAHKTLKIGGMTCANCAERIENRLRKLPGVEQVAVSYAKGRAEVDYAPELVRPEQLVAAVEALDYQVLPQGSGQGAGWRKGAGALIVVLALFLLLRQFGLDRLFDRFPLAQEGMGYGMLFMIGLMTSVHCLAMCGGINLSQCLPAAEAAAAGRLANLRPSLFYNLGRVISYTVVGALVGALGSVITFSGAARGLVQLAAGVFMVIMGLNMLGVFPGLRRLVPRLPQSWGLRLKQRSGTSKSPLIVGLLNGLMPCGPLQAMQLYALSTGDPVRGALSMMLFSLGTVPLMFSFGSLSTLLGRKFRSRVMTVGAALVVVLGISMFSTGLNLSGIQLLPDALQTAQGSGGSTEQVQGQTAAPGMRGGAPLEAAAADEEDTELELPPIVDGVQMVETTLWRSYFEPITVQVGIPVHWTITAERSQITGCNGGIYIATYGITQYFDEGENVIEFTPTEVGRFGYSCWMGMMRSSITVVEAQS